MHSDACAEFVHDLRLPLQVISSCAQLLAAEGRGGPYADMLLESVAEANRLLAGYLQAWREDEAPFCPQRSDIVLLARSLCRRWQARAQEKSLSLRLTANAEALEFAFDAERVSRALQNLLANALRYAPRGSTVDVELEALGDYLELRVRDAGPGPQSVPAESEGYGLGLKIARACAALHGGSLRIEGGPGQGCACVLRLPLAGTPRAAEA